MKTSNYTKPIVLLFMAFIFLMNGNAQNNVLVKKDSSKIFSTSFNFSSIPNQKSSFNFTLKNKPAHFTLFYDTLYNKRILYDYYRHEYFFQDPLIPYSNAQNALFCGTLNYLWFLFEKKK